MIRAGLSVLAGYLLGCVAGTAAATLLFVVQAAANGQPVGPVLAFAAYLLRAVLVLGAPGWLLLRLLAVPAARRRGWGGARLLAVFAACGAANALGALVAMIWLIGGSLAGQSDLGLLLGSFLAAGAAAGAGAWAGERLVAPRPPLRGALP